VDDADVDTELVAYWATRAAKTGDEHACKGISMQ
jgi:hypothetical protein